MMPSLNFFISLQLNSNSKNVCSNNTHVVASSIPKPCSEEAIQHRERYIQAKNHPFQGASPVEVLAHTYGQALEIILDSNLNLSGNLGGILINMRENGYLRICPNIRIHPNMFEDSFRDILSGVFEGREVQEGAISRHNTNISNLFDLPEEGEELEDVFFTPGRLVLGCLLGDRGGRYVMPLRACMDHSVRVDETLVFVIGWFQNYVNLGQEIDIMVGVEGEPDESVEILKRECEQKWNIRG